MVKILRKYQKIFGGALLAPGQIAQFGSLKAGAPQYSLDPDVIQALAAFDNGWDAAAIDTGGGLNSPALQDDNALNFLWSRQLAYLFQAGIPEWDAATIYFANSFVSVAGAIYISRVDNNVGNLVTDTNSWKSLVSTIGATGIAKAWVCFNGTGGLGPQAIASGFNVASVTKTGTGIYQLAFITNLADINYAPVGSCGTPNGVGFAVGDDNIITFGFNGQIGNKTPAGCTLYCSDSRNLALQDAQAITIHVFGN